MIEKETDEWAFYYSLGQYLEKKIRYGTLCRTILKMNFRDYRLHYIKALYYRHKQDFIQAEHEIRASIELLEEMRNKRHTDLCSINMQMLMVPTNDGSWIFPTKTIASSHEIYFLAGEIFAINDKDDDALTAYLKYQTIVMSLKPDDGYDCLYSFRKYNTYTVSDLINNEITVCHPSMMNDPFDSLVVLWSDLIDGRCSEHKHVPALRHSFDYMRIRSFVKGDGQSVLKNIVMWSHYADEHKGFCVCYNFSKDFLSTENESRTFKKVRYKRPGSHVNITKSSINTATGVYTKHNLWKYENEVRLVSYNPAIKGKIAHIPMDSKSYIQSIYFGLKCDEDTVRTIMCLLHGRKIRFYRMRSDPSNIYVTISH